MRKSLLSFVVLISLGSGLAFQYVGGAFNGGSSGQLWTVVQGPTLSSPCTSSSATCNITVTGTGTNHLLVIGLGAALTGQQIYNISTNGTGGVGGNYCYGAGCSNSFTSCYSFDTLDAFSSDCGYYLQGPHGATTITVQRTTSSTGGWRVCFAELSTSGTATFDTVNSADNNASTTPPGVALTLTGTSTNPDVIFQRITGGTVNSPYISSPYDTYVAHGGNYGCALSINTLTGTAPQWTTNSSKSAVSGAAWHS